MRENVRDESVVKFEVAIVLEGAVKLTMSKF